MRRGGRGRQSLVDTSSFKSTSVGLTLGCVPDSPFCELLAEVAGRLGPLNSLSIVSLGLSLVSEKNGVTCGVGESSSSVSDSKSTSILDKRRFL